MLFHLPLWNVASNWFFLQRPQLTQYLTVLFLKEPQVYIDYIQGHQWYNIFWVAQKKKAYHIWCRCPFSCVCIKNLINLWVSSKHAPCYCGLAIRKLSELPNDGVVPMTKNDYFFAAHFLCMFMNSLESISDEWSIGVCWVSPFSRMFRMKKHVLFSLTSWSTNTKCDFMVFVQVIEILSTINKLH